jgi:hypothetical protein
MKRARKEGKREKGKRKEGKGGKGERGKGKGETYMGSLFPPCIQHLRRYS